MICTRCEGRMVHERFEDLVDDQGRYNFMGWRCLNCGEIHDHLIIDNRRNQSKSVGPAGLGVGRSS
jgi:hypothetical protein